MTVEPPLLINFNELNMNLVKKENAEFTKKSSYKEGHQWDPYHWGSDVDEPIGQEWRDTQENDVVEQVVLMFLDL